MSKLARELTSKEYINHLFSKELDGYIQVMQLKNNQVIDIKNYKSMTLEDALNKYSNEFDIFITPNTNYNGRRSSSNIRQLRALYIDLDHRGYSFHELFYAMWDLVLDCKIPEPTMVVASGRGAHIYWRIEHAPSQALATWQELEDYLWYQLKDLGADKKATDAARVLRLPDTLNSRSNTECKVMIVNDKITYSMYDLREQYLKWKPKVIRQEVIKEVINKRKVEHKVLHYFTSYTLHLARTEDILTICKLRNYRVTGYRNMILHCYVYWLGVTHRDPEELTTSVNELNNQFTEPMKQTEVDAILRCVPKAIDKFLKYEQGLRSGEVKRVSKGMRDKGGYWYKNDTLIERLGITRAEQQYLKTIIDEKEKYRRGGEEKKAKQKAKRRNIKGLTPKQQELANLTKVIIVLKSKNISNRAIARELGISEYKVRSLLK